jgi:uncharacterized iron-regulated membrane protein
MTARLVFNAHLLIALVFGTFITVIAVTGCIIAFEPELDRMMHADFSYVRPGIRTPVICRNHERREASASGRTDRRVHTFLSW